MTEWNPLYLSHIGRVKADYTLSAPDLDPDEITRKLSIQPDASGRRGDPRLNGKGEPMGGDEREGWWQISSDGLDSKDINAHLDSLLARLLPQEQVILEVIKEGQTESYFDILWESSYLYAGTGPILETRTVNGIGRLNASIGFDIYQIDSEEKNDDIDNDAKHCNPPTKP